MTQTFTLTQTQIKTLAEMANHFKDIPEFKIVIKNGSGIGPTYSVQFSLFGKEVNVDNTDVSTW
jgi:tripartite-type tricarboxylate transporter receptor subunit TctC